MILNCELIIGNKQERARSAADLACVAGVQRGGRGEVECEREARSLSARRERLP